METKSVKSMYELMSNVKEFSRVKYPWHKDTEKPVLELIKGANVNRVTERFTLHICTDCAILWVGRNVSLFDDVLTDSKQLLKNTTTQRKFKLSDKDLISVVNKYQSTLRGAEKSEKKQAVKKAESVTA